MSTKGISEMLSVTQTKYIKEVRAVKEVSVAKISSMNEII